MKQGTPRVFALLALTFSLSISAQERGNWITDANGCKAWNPNPRPNESIVWSARCTNGFVTGSGTLQWFLDGKPNGENTGTFADGKQTGQGNSVAANGVTTEGRWENGQAVYGTARWPNGNTYTGPFVEGHRTGRGVFTWASGDRYEGDFLEGKLQGQGTLTKANGDKYVGGWENGKLSGKATIAKSGAAPVSGTVTDGKFVPDAAAGAGKDAVTSVVDSIAPRDIVTGQRSLNLESESEEIKRTTAQAAQLINGARAQGAGVDTDAAMTEKLRTIMTRIARVSHRPGLPWEVHLIEAPTINAFTIGGGKLFFWRGVFGGLIDPKNDDEIAAVMAHEIGHVNLRHVGKSEGANIGSVIMNHGKANADTMYRASFTTLQEDEADRLGLLYMALAGFDPRAASQIWARAHQKYGSNPGNYSYDHSLNADRLRKVASITPKVLQYFKGEGTENPDFARLRSQNDIIPRVASAGDSENGAFALLEAGLGVFGDNLRAKNEEMSRKLASQSQGAAAQNVQILGFKIANTTAGTRGLFGQLRNDGPSAIRTAQITLYYQDASGKSLYKQQIQLPAMTLGVGAVAPWSAQLLNVPGSTKIHPAITSVTLAQ